MKAITNKSDYEKANLKIEALLKLVGNKTSETDANFIELDKLSDLIAAYEEEHYSMKPDSLIEMIQLRMFQRKLKQKDLADLLETSPSRVSELLNGKLKLNYSFARNLYNKLNIDAALIFNS